MDKFYMAGTEGTGRYIVVLAGALGRVGYRALDNGQFRIRIEPASPEAGSKLRASFPGYKEGVGGKEYRFSTVTHGEDRMRTEIGRAIKALVPGAAVEVNPAAPDWAKDLVEAAAGETVVESKPAPSPADTAASEPGVTTGGDDRESLVARARQLGIRGVSSRWTEETLRRKIAAAAQAKPLDLEAPQETRGAETESEERDRLVSAVRERKLPGANAAGRWSLATLRAKLAAV